MKDVISVDSNSKSEDTSLDDIIRNIFITAEGGGMYDIYLKTVKNVLMTWHKQQQIKLIERIEGEVIPAGALTGDPRGFGDIAPVAYSAINNCMKRQREAINKVKESL